MNRWISIEPGCKMPAEGEEVLITVCEDMSYGKYTDVELHTDIGSYSKEGGYIDSANGIGGFDTINDWDEGQPIKVIAWMKKPDPYLYNNGLWDQEYIKKKFKI